jgi:type VI protein secretion system component VasF
VHVTQPQRVKLQPDGSYLVDPPPQKPVPWWVRVGAVLAVLALALLLTSITVTTYRTIFPRVQAPTQYYVCVYISAEGTSTVSGPQPCPRP